MDLDADMVGHKAHVAKNPVLPAANTAEIGAIASSMKRDISLQDEANRLKRLRDEKGFDAFKLRISTTDQYRSEARFR